MARLMVVLLGVLLLAGAAQAQVTTQPDQSLAPRPSACGAGSQSVRVCVNGLQSCTDVCAARALSVNADIAGCSTSCCNRYNVCVQMRNCGNLKRDCN